MGLVGIESRQLVGQRQQHPGHGAGLIDAQLQGIAVWRAGLEGDAGSLLDQPICASDALQRGARSSVMFTPPQWCLPPIFQAGRFVSHCQIRSEFGEIIFLYSRPSLRFKIGHTECMHLSF